MDKVRNPSAAEMQRFWDLVASTAGRLKARIETVQCMAIDARLTLTGDDADRKPDRTVHTRQQIAHELGCVTDEVEALLADIRAAAKAERTRLQ